MHSPPPPNPLPQRGGGAKQAVVRQHSLPPCGGGSGWGGYERYGSTSKLSEESGRTNGEALGLSDPIGAVGLENAMGSARLS
ncbi:hypothetical protein BN874_2610007 [Candidatus Contendobacter odensis Run_B_J11]|uniref:Uncharacterized protein n=1 Tax=Candidatus Contendobacter odensis Run_B_J11 TaxID=1400861 RepID=A0A7U7GBX7_9GAMM|nr:hypothetical protein BN874_2610007 [Candidatus Contendobacter odensis Run_B_J11]